MGRYRFTFVVAFAAFFVTTTLTLSDADARRHRRRHARHGHVNAKALEGLKKPYEWGMSIKQVLKVLKRHIKAKYDAKIQATRDPYVQDGLRKRMAREYQRIVKSLITFNGKNRSWDVSMIEKEFVQRNGEAMLSVWENRGGKNQRKFFFFYNKRLYKILTALDMSKFKVRDFNKIKAILERKFGSGTTSYRKVDGIKEPEAVTWSTHRIRVRAVDKLRFHGTFILAVEGVKLSARCYGHRPPPRKKKKNAIIKAMTTDPNSKPDLSEGADTIDSLIKGKK